MNGRETSLPMLSSQSSPCPISPNLERKGGGTQPQIARIVTFIRGTIHTDRSPTFVGVTVACRIRTGELKDNATGNTLLWHKDCMITPIPTHYVLLARVRTVASHRSQDCSMTSRCEASLWVERRSARYPRSSSMVFCEKVTQR